MRKLMLLVSLSLVLNISFAQFPLASTPYTQNFDNLGLTGGTAAGGDLNIISTGLNGWYFLESGTNMNNTFSAGSGTSNTGDTYNFGIGGNSNRTLGGLQSGSLIPSYGFWFTNNTGTTIVSLMITYAGETWRIGATSRPDRIDFQYSTDATSLSTGTWTDFDALDYEIPGQGATNNGSLLHTATISNTITGLNILNGTNFFIRWTDLNASGADDGMGINDFSMVATLSSNTITTGTVSTPPFILVDCSDTETGTVAYTSTGTFNAGNIFTAQLSDDLGSFTSPVNIGSQANSGNDPSGTINITIPAGTVGGTAYRIRVISNDPGILGSASSSFTIQQNGLGGCATSNTDYFRSVQTGDWSNISTWESSPDNTNWIAATLTPTYNANTTWIQSTHTVTINSSVTVDQVEINNGGILDFTSGTLTVMDGIGQDININSGGIFILSQLATPPAFSGAAPTIRVNTGGILRVAATGMTGAGTGVNSNNYD